MEGKHRCPPHPGSRVRSHLVWAARPASGSLLLRSCPAVRLSAPHAQQHSRLPCPSPPASVSPSSRPLRRWCHPSISSSVALFSFRPQSFPASGSLPMSRLFASGGQGIMKWSALVLNFINPHIAYLPSIPYLYSHQHEDKPSLPITFVYIWHGTTGLVQGACTSG